VRAGLKWVVVSVCVGLAACVSSADDEAAYTIERGLHAALDRAYAQSPPTGLTSGALYDLVKRAQSDIDGVTESCVGTPAYSLSALDGRIAVWAKCNDAEKRSDWRPKT
jgi:hypothetical protein